MRNKSRSRHSKLRLVAVLTALLTLALLVSAGLRIKDYASGSVVTYDLRDYLYEADRGRYGYLYETALRDMNKNTSYSPEVAEYRALAFCYEQAVLEQAYRQVGQEEKAQEFARRRQEYEGQLGSLSPWADKIRQAVSPAGDGRPAP